MGVIRKVASVSTLGLIDFRSDRERIARYTKQARDDQRQEIARRAAERDAVARAVVVQESAPLTPEEIVSLQMELDEVMAALVNAAEDGRAPVMRAAVTDARARLAEVRAAMDGAR